MAEKVVQMNILEWLKSQNRCPAKTDGNGVLNREEIERWRAYSLVLKELCECPLLCGSYDAKNGKEDYMYGISTVMERIACGVSEECYEKFNEEFMLNMCKSEEVLEDGD